MIQRRLKREKRAALASPGMGPAKPAERRASGAAQSKAGTASVPVQ
jgi:hypothetical protein